MCVVLTILSYLSVTVPEISREPHSGHLSKSFTSTLSTFSGLLLMVVFCPGGRPLRPGSLGSDAVTVLMPFFSAVSSWLAFL